MPRSILQVHGFGELAQKRDYKYDETVMQCFNLIECVFQSFYLDVGKLQNFVLIAHQTASEDHTRDLLTHLHTVGTAFAPLVYDLPSDAGCEVLVGRCKGLWEALQETPDLSLTAVSVNGASLNKPHTNDDIKGAVFLFICLFIFIHHFTSVTILTTNKKSIT